MAKYVRKRGSRRLRRVIKRASKKVPKKVKKFVKTALARQVETKFAANDANGQLTTSNVTPRTLVVTNTLSQYPLIPQGVQRHQRVGNKIFVRRMKVTFQFYLSAAASQDFQFRIIMWKPKLLSDVLTAQNDILTTFNGLASENINKTFWNSEDVTIHKDSGMMTWRAPSAYGKSIYKYSFWVPRHTVLFSTNAAERPTDRMYCFSFMTAYNGLNQTVDWFARTDMEFKDP